MRYGYLWLTVINLLAVWLTVKDKHAARRKKRRVSENGLLVTALLGGSIGMFLTMLLIRHKTKKVKFMLGIPCILAVQAVALTWVYHIMV